MLRTGATPSGKDAVSFSDLLGYFEVGANPEDFDGQANTTIVVFRADRLEAGLTAGRITNTAYASLDSWQSLEDQPNFRTRTNAMWAGSAGNLQVQNRNFDGESIQASTPAESVIADEFHIGVNLWRSNGDTVAIVRNADNERSTGSAIGGLAEPEGHLHTRIGAGSLSGSAGGGVAQLFDGDIAAVLVYNRELSDSELIEVEEYLRGLYLEDGEDAALPVTDELVLHLNAENVIVGEDGVTQMTDLSGRGNHAVAFIGDPRPLPTEAPTFISNATSTGRGAVHFDGEAQFLDILSNPEQFDGRAKSVFVIFSAAELANDQRFYSFGYSSLHPANTDPHFSVHGMWVTEDGSMRANVRSETGGFIGHSPPGGGAEPDTFYLGASIWKESGNLEVIFRNEEHERVSGERSGGTADPTGHQMTRIGADSGIGTPSPRQYFHGEIAAMVVFNRELSSAEAIAVEEWLLEKYLSRNQSIAYDEWITSFDVPEGLRGPEQDASGDGVLNLIKFALGQDPRVATREGLPSISIEELDEDSYLTITMSKNPLAAGITFNVEISPDLEIWNSGSEEIVILEDSPELLKVRSASALTAETKQFMRITMSVEGEK